MSVQNKQKWVLIICLLLSFLNSFGGNNNISLTHKSSGAITINIRYNEAQPGDTLWLNLDNVLYGTSLKTNFGSYHATGDGKWFRFVVPVKSEYGYFDIYKKRTFTDNGSATNMMPLLMYAFWEKGDNVAIHLSKKETLMYSGFEPICSFSGRGSVKYTARYIADSTYRSTLVSLWSSPSANIPVFDSEMNYQHINSDKAIGKGLLSASAYRYRMSAVSYEILKADLIFSDLCFMPGVIKEFYKNNIANAPDSVKNRFVNAYQKVFNKPDTKGITVRALSASKYYIDFLVAKFNIESSFLHSGYDLDWVFNSITKHTNGPIRDRVLIITILTHQRIDHIQDVFAKATRIIKEPNCLNALKSIRSAAPGQPFMNFELQDTNGKMIRLSDFKGKVVLIDFWFNGCKYCTDFYQTALSKVEKDHEGNKNVVFISISGDRGKSLWSKGISSGDYTSESAVNLFTNGQGFTHPVMTNYSINACPFVLLINKSGNIVYRNAPLLYQYEKLSAAIKSIE